MKTVVIVNGYPKSGKDTLIGHMRLLLSNHKRQSYNVSMIDPTRDMLSRHTAISSKDLAEKSPKCRKLLATVHRALLDFSDAPLRAFYNQIPWSEGPVVFTCCREPDTIRRLKHYLGAHGIQVYTLFVARDVHEEPTTDADRDVVHYVYDLTVDNNAPPEFLPRLAAEVCDHFHLLDRF